MEMRRPLTVESAMGRGAVLGGSEPLETFLNDGRVFAVVIGVHLNIRRANVNLVAPVLFNRPTFIFRLLSVYQNL